MLDDSLGMEPQQHPGLAALDKRQRAKEDLTDALAQLKRNTSHYTSAANLTNVNNANIRYSVGKILRMAVGLGYSHATAAALVGGSAVSIRNWLRRGDNGEAFFAEWALEFRQAEALALINENEALQFDMAIGNRAASVRAKRLEKREEMFEKSAVNADDNIDISMFTNAELDEYIETGNIPPRFRAGHVEAQPLTLAEMLETVGDSEIELLRAKLAEFEEDLQPIPTKGVCPIVKQIGDGRES